VRKNLVCLVPILAAASFLDALASPADRQQFCIQALSIANQNSQLIRKLF
jgi:hypothetical protein